MGAPLRGAFRTARCACDNRGAMPLDDRFDDLVASLTGFYRAWVISSGSSLAVRPLARGRRERADAGAAGHRRRGRGRAHLRLVRRRVRRRPRADDGSRVRLDPDVATILLEKDRPEYLGGQFTYTVTASLDYDAMAEYVRTGVPVGSRSARYYRAIEELTRQDIAVFFGRRSPPCPTWWRTSSGE